MLKVLLVVALLAIATYALVRVIERRGVAPVRRPSAPASPPRRPFGPDDDEDFLRDLGRRRRQPGSSGDTDDPS